MPKHLYTIPSGLALPSPTTDLPEGYPFLLLQSDESIPGELHCLQNGIFKRMVPDPQPAATVTGTRTPVTFVGKVLTTAAGTSVVCSYEGVPGGRFIVPQGISSNGPEENYGQLREISMCMDTALAPTDSIYINIASTYANGDPSAWNPWFGGAWPTLTAVDRLLDDEVLYDVTGDNLLQPGSSLTMTLGIGAGYTASADAYVTVTLWFGELNISGTADTLTDEGEPRRLGRNAELTEREHELEG